MKIVNSRGCNLLVAWNSHGANLFAVKKGWNSPEGGKQSFSGESQFARGFTNFVYNFWLTDMITIPSMSFGAMEHWGLVTYRLRALLYDKRNSAISDKYYISSIVAHELAHQVRV